MLFGPVGSMARPSIIQAFQARFQRRLFSWLRNKSSGKSFINIGQAGRVAYRGSFTSMTRNTRIYSYFAAAFLFASVLSIPEASAQQQAPTPPASSESSNASPKAGSQDATTGKSKLEKETGTVNDRIFDVLPNYGTVENASELPRLSTGQKYRIATASVFDWASYPFNATLAAIAQAKNDPASWGQGWGAYAERFGESFADNSIGTYMTVAIFPSLLREDPRYYQMGKGTFSHRAVYAASRLFVTRTDSGDDRFNYSESIGNAAAAAISNVYHPAEDRTAGRNADTFAFLILYDGLSNEIKEFWPDIRRKVFHKQNP
jgi:hypothetical protein